MNVTTLQNSSSFQKLYFFLVHIGGLQPIPRDPKDNGVAAMLDDRTFCFVIQQGHHTDVLLDLLGLVANHLQKQ